MNGTMSCSCQSFDKAEMCSRRVNIGHHTERKMHVGKAAAAAVAKRAFKQKTLPFGKRPKPAVTVPELTAGASRDADTAVPFS